MGTYKQRLVTLEKLNQLSKPEAKEALAKCCGASKWVNCMEAQRPFESIDQLHQLAEEIWLSASNDDWLEAFSHHPKIGDRKSLEKKFIATNDWSNDEQKSVSSASRSTLEALLNLNDAYEEKFGFIFIVCATGKSAEDMLELLKKRLPNDRQEELQIAMGEQNKITKLRLDKLLT